MPDRPLTPDHTDADGDADGDADTDTEPPPTWSAVTINFEDLGNAEVVSNQYADNAVFSSDSGYEVRTDSYDMFGNSEPRYVCTVTIGGDLTCTESITVDFTRPVRELTIDAVGDTDTGTIAKVRVLAEGTLLGTVNVEGNGDDSDTQTTDLTACEGVTSIEIVDVTDAHGLAWEDLVFEQQD